MEALIMKIKSSVMAMLVVVVIFGGITVAKAADIWSTKNSNSYFSEGGGQNEESIKGSTTFDDVLKFGITQEQIESVIGDDMPPGSQKVKDYCTENGLAFSTIKEELNELLN
jgi:hypothetical protein